MRVLNKDGKSFIILEDDETFTVGEARIDFWLRGSNQNPDDTVKMIVVEKTTA